MTRDALAKSSPGGLAKYNPEKGLKTIAAASALEKHFALAKDATGLQRAIRVKLQAQSDYALWWYTQADKAKRGQPKKYSDRSVGILHAGQNGLPEEYVARRWHKKLNGSPEQFDTAVETSLARYVNIVEFAPIDAQLKASNSNEWYTPAQYLAAARAVLGGIDLDPASNQTANETVQATTFFNINDDGLSRQWIGRVWLNPPYGGLSAPFTARLLEQFTAGNTTAAVLLVNSNSTDAAWFQPLWDFLLCFTNHRINFIAPHGQQSGSTHGSVFVYLGPERDRFIREFSGFGAIVERAQ